MPRNWRRERRGDDSENKRQAHDEVDSPRFPRMEHRRAGNLTGPTGAPSFFREGRLVLRGGKEWTPIHKSHGVAEWSKSVLTNRRALLRQSLRVSMTNSPLTHFEIPIRRGAASGMWR